jgi:hypothetical protein
MSAFGAISQIPPARGGAALRDFTFFGKISLQSPTRDKVDYEASGKSNVILPQCQLHSATKLSKLEI